MQVVFSVIIPVYKVEKYISECIDSVLNQTFSNFEILCVDDCGEDNSIKIVEEYAKRDSRIKILHHEKNRGLSAARNTGLNAACGEYIVCLDSDDWLELDCLEVLYREFQEKKTESIWFDAYQYNDYLKMRQIQPLLNNKAGYLEITPQNICNFSDYSWIKAYKTSSIKDNNIYWPEGLLFEDGEFYFKYFTHNPKTYIIENCLYNYRIREGSIVNNAKFGKVKIEDIYSVVRNIREFYIEHGLYEKYKFAVLQLMNMRINTCKNICNNYQKSIKLSDSIIKDFNFPNDFEGFKPETGPTFSVIVPIYNVEQYVEQCLKSILQQTFGDFEILCVDDCGNDNSMQIVKALKENDSRIKIIKHRKNKGLGAARNTALKKAKGKYVICVDSDDWMQSTCLEEVYNKFKTTGLNSIWYKCEFWWEEQKRMTEMFSFPELLSAKEGFYVLDGNNIANYPMYAWNKAFRRSFLIENKIFWSEGIFFEDMEFGFKTGIKSPNIYIVDKPLYVYRRRNDSIICSCINDAEKAKDVFAASLNLYNYLMKNGLLDRYKNAFLRYVSDNINMFRSYPETQKKLMPYIREFLEKIKPEDDVWNGYNFI